MWPRRGGRCDLHAAGYKIDAETAAEADEEAVVHAADTRLEERKGPYGGPSHGFHVGVTRPRHGIAFTTFGSHESNVAVRYLQRLVGARGTDAVPDGRPAEEVAKIGARALREGGMLASADQVVTSARSA